MTKTDLKFIRQRITSLRIKRGISEYRMSIELGHSGSYIQSIASGRALPSLSEFLYICEYLNVSPSAFFDERTDEPFLLQRAAEDMHCLSDKDLILLLSIIERLKTLSDRESDKKAKS